MRIKEIGRRRAGLTEASACEHELRGDSCAECRYRGHVYVTDEGTHYHRTAFCRGIESGWAEAIRRGDGVHRTNRIPISAVIVGEYAPCSVCRPALVHGMAATH